MSEDLQSLLEKINRDGVEKANAAAEAILADAKAKAADIVKAANAEAAKAKADAEKASADYAARAAETKAALEAHADYVKNEILALALGFGQAEGPAVDLNGHTARISVKPVARN